MDQSKSIDKIPEWFHGSRLNYAENMLRYDDDRVAIYAAGKASDAFRVEKMFISQETGHFSTIFMCFYKKTKFSFKFQNFLQNTKISHKSHYQYPFSSSCALIKGTGSQRICRNFRRYKKHWWYVATTNTFMKKEIRNRNMGYSMSTPWMCTAVFVYACYYHSKVTNIRREVTRNKSTTLIGLHLDS